jgi:hypothetical protein
MCPGLCRPMQVYVLIRPGRDRDLPLLLQQGGGGEFALTEVTVRCCVSCAVHLTCATFRSRSRRARLAQPTSAGSRLHARRVSLAITIQRRVAAASIALSASSGASCFSSSRPRPFVRLRVIVIGVRSATTGATACKLCPVGRVAATIGLESCTVCNGSSYQKEEGKGGTQAVFALILTFGVRGCGCWFVPRSSSHSWLCIDQPSV